MDRAKPRLLVAYGMESTFAQTTRDYLEALKKYTGCDVSFIHVTHDAVLNVDLEDYDIVFQNYCSRLCFEGYVSENFKEKLSRFSGVKVLSVQDEYNRTNVLKTAIKDLGFDVVLTCVPKNSVEYVYPKSEFPNVEFVPVLTGYVSQDFVAGEAVHTPLAERPVLIGYRGRRLGANYGELGYEKFEIGRRMQEICTARGVPCDIAMDEGSRIYGQEWFSFIGSCRAVLGSESGSNVFDFDGAIEREYIRQTSANGGVPPGYAAFKSIVETRENEIDMGQISPRIFEYALMRTPMILFRGKYSDALKQGEHYIPLEKDFSNIDTVLAELYDLPALERMAGRAYEHLVGSGQFGYRAYGKMLREVFDRHIAGKPRRTGVCCSPDAQDQLSLAEAPTEWPQTHHAFRAKQMRMRGVNNLAQIATLETLYGNAIKRNLASASRIATFLQYLEKLSEHGNASQDLRVSRLMDSLVRRTGAIASAQTGHKERLAAILREQKDSVGNELFTERLNWIGEYANLFNDLQASYVAVFADIHSVAEKKLSELRNSLSPFAVLRLTWKLRTISLGGAKLEFAKAIVRKSRLANKIALMGMGFLGRG